MAITNAADFIAVWTELDALYDILPQGDYTDGTGFSPGPGATDATSAAGGTYADLVTHGINAGTIGEAVLAVNLAFIELANDYVAYLQAGNPPILGIAKERGPSDPGQSYHDNILGNIGDGPIQSRFLDHDVLDIDVTGDGIDDLDGDPRSVDAQGFGARPYYDGTAGDAADKVNTVVWDLENGINLTGDFLEAFNQSFETSTDGFFGGIPFGATDYGTVTMVASGTGGIASPDGSSHAILEQAPVGNPDGSGPFTRFDAYRDDFGEGFVTEIQIYLDTAWALGEGFDYSVAANGQDGNHQRDFIFHVTKDTSTGDLLVGASNNTSFDPDEELENGNHAEITASGWYTFQHFFFDAGDGTLAVAMSVFDSAGNHVFTEVRNDVSDTIATEVGGNRYAWFTNIDVTGGIAVDEAKIAFAEPVGITRDGDADPNTLTGTVFDDVLNGNDGNDTLIGKDGNDTFNGGDGIDTAVIADNGGAPFDPNDFDFSGLFVIGGSISGTVTGPDGTETLDSIEVLEIANTGSSTFIVLNGTSLQAAIDAAEAGDTIILQPGTYTGDFNIPAGKNGLTILGAFEGVSGSDNSRDMVDGVGESSIDGRLAILSNDVTIDGIRVEDGLSGPPFDFAGIQVQGENVTITNSLFYRSGTVDDDGSRAIVNAINQADGLTISNNAMTGWQSGTFINGTNDVTISGNLYDGNSRGVSADAYPGGNSNLQVTGNTFDNLIEDMGFWGDAASWNGASLIDQNTFNKGIFDYDPADNSALIGANNVFVPGAVTIQGGDDTVYTSIQEAIDAATAGDTIIVSNGEYTEDITLKSGVSIMGESEAGVIINGTMTTPAGFADATIENMTVRNVGDTMLLDMTGTTSVTDIVFENVTFSLTDDFTGAVAIGNGQGVLPMAINDGGDADDAGLTFLNVTMDSNNFEAGTTSFIYTTTESVGGAKIVLDGVNLVGTSSGGPTGLGAQWNMNGEDSSFVEIVNSNTSEGGNFYVSGFLGVLIDGNVFDGLGVALNGVKDATVTDNIFQNIDDDLFAGGTPEQHRGLAIEDAWGTDGVSGLIVTGNTFQNIDALDGAIAFQRWTDGTPPNLATIDRLNDVQIGDNTFLGLGAGVVPIFVNDTYFGAGAVIPADLDADQLIIGTDGNDTINDNSAGGSAIFADAGNDTVNAGSGDDNVNGGDGDDDLNGGGGKDTLDGGAGTNTLRGGGNDDTYIVRTNNDTVDESGTSGIDTVLSEISYTLGNNVENLVLTGAGPLDGTGNGLDNEITGNGDENLIKGGSGADLIDGKGGDDDLRGQGGDDTIEGGGGNDTLNGGGGNDKLTGGAGNDNFVFDAKGGNNADRVTDFKVGTDLIHVDKDAFKKIGPKNDTLKTKFFEVGNKADDKNDRFIYNENNGKFFYDQDGNKNGFDKVLVARLDKNLNLSEDDIFVI
ncbi:beta strand repeat-containing protein [Bauldia sp.]|uniref:beta strand repeat-containing protein n=1 Tax=Bauldia sp. TaxID=2575872 RepID=UPI003BAADB14